MMCNRGSWLEETETQWFVVGDLTFLNVFFLPLRLRLEGRKINLQKLETVNHYVIKKLKVGLKSFEKLTLEMRSITTFYASF